MCIALMWLFALLLVLGGATTVGSLAQTAPEAPGDHTLEGDHHSGGHSDRGYHRSFDQAEKWAKEFDDPSRDAWQKPNEVLDALHLDRTARVADLGAGTGYFSARIARLIPEGKLFAVDIEPDMLRFLGERAQREHLSFLVPVLASAGSPNLPEPVDLVLVVDSTPPAIRFSPRICSCPGNISSCSEPTRLELRQQWICTHPIHCCARQALLICRSKARRATRAPEWA